MSVQLSKSYPFRSLARHYKLPYGMMLSVADAALSGTPTYWSRSGIAYINAQLSAQDLVDLLAYIRRIHAEYGRLQ